MHEAVPVVHSTPLKDINRPSINIFDAATPVVRGAISLLIYIFYLFTMSDNSGNSGKVCGV